MSGEQEANFDRLNAGMRELQDGKGVDRPDFTRFPMEVSVELVDPLWIASQHEIPKSMFREQ